MEYSAIIGLVILGIGLVFTLIKYVQLKKTTGIDLSDFISIYSDQLIDICNDTAKQLLSTGNTYDSKDEFIDDLVENIYFSINENAEGFGIDKKYLKYFTESNIEMIINFIVYRQCPDIFDLFFGAQEEITGEAETPTTDVDNTTNSITTTDISYQTETLLSSDNTNTQDI